MLHVHVCNMQVTKRPEEGFGSSRAGVTGGCEPNLRVGARSQTQGSGKAASIPNH